MQIQNIEKQKLYEQIVQLTTERNQLRRKVVQLEKDANILPEEGEIVRP